MAQPGESLAKDLTPAEFERFRDYIHQHSGIFLEEQKADSLRISLVTRATRFGLLSLEEYYKLLVNDEAEFRELMNLVTINETSFFRFPAQFDALRQDVVPAILEGKSATQNTFRAWSAGCSTGEEPYSIAMTLLDSGLEGLGYAIDVLGTDVSTNALDRARAAIYPARALLSVPHSVSSRFFVPTPRGHQVVEKARNLVDFQYHNLIKEPYPLGLMGNWDVIFCRNVTIYFRLESTRRVVENFFNSLNPGGYLFIGHSETLTSISDKFEPVEVGGVFLYRKPLPRRSGFAAFTADRAVRQRPTATASAARRARLQQRSSGAPASVAPAAPSADQDGPTTVSTLVRAREATMQGRRNEVLELSREVLVSEPDNPEALLLLAWAHADAGNLESAEAEALRALQVDPLIAAARYILGMIHMRRDDPASAMAEFKRTVYADPDFVLAHLNLGNLYRAQGSWADACRHYDNAARTLNSNPEGDWNVFMGGFQPDLLAKTCERSLIECRKAMGRD